MATATIPLTGFTSKTRYDGVTYYNPTETFTLPANTGVTSAVLNFTITNTGGQFADKSAQLNATRAHSGWLAPGQSLDATLLNSGGDNTFRLTFKAGSTYATWGVSNVSLVVTYNEPYATKVWNGSSWMNGTPYVWNGSKWVAGVSYVWNGNAWMPGKS